MWGPSLERIAEQRVHARLYRFAVTAAFAALAIALCAMLGWIFDVPVLRSVIPGRPPLLPLTAAAIVVAALGALGAAPSERTRARGVLSSIAGALVTAFGVVVLAEYLLGWHLRLEELAFGRELPGPYPGRPSPPTAAALILIGVAILLFDVETKRHVRPSVIAAVTAFFVSFITLTAYAYGIGFVYEIGHRTVIGVAFPTGIALALLSAALVVLRPDGETMRVLMARGIAGRAARTLVMVSLVIPPAIGVLVELLVHFGLRSTPIALAVVAVSSIPVTLSLVFMNARALDAAERKMHETERRFRSMFEQSSDAKFLADPNGACVHLNDRAVEMLGHPPEEVLGRTLASFLDEPDRSVALARKEAVQRGERVPTIQWTVRRKDGTRVPVEVTTIGFDDGGYAVTARDISDRVRAAENLARAHETERLLHERIEAVSRAVSAVSDAVAALAATDVQTMLQTIVIQAQQLTGARYGAIGILDEQDPDRFRTWVSAGFDPSSTQELAPPKAASGLLSEVAHDGRIVRVSAAQLERAAFGLPLGQPSVTSFLGVPVEYRGRPVANLYLAEKRGGKFTEEDEQMATLLAGRIGSALETARLYEAEVAARNWLQHVVDEMPEGVVITDALGNVTSTNRRAREYVTSGSDTGTLSGIELRTAAGAQVAWQDLPLAEATTHQRTIGNVEVMVRDRHGRDVPLIASAAPVFDAGRPIGAVIVLQDVTVLKELERMREQWTSIVAHDLRQPIAVLTLASQAIVRREQAALSPEGRKALGTILNASTKLDRMVNDLLDASRIEARRLTILPEPLDLCDLVEEVVERAVATTKGAEMRLDLQRPVPRVAGDPDRLEQVLMNLLSNAAKYGDPGKPIDVAVAAKEGFVDVRVTNRGRGLDRSEIDMLFSRYARTSTGRTSREGIGLGLYITKGLVEAHGGRIDVDSVPGGETTFHVTLPALDGVGTQELAHFDSRRSRAPRRSRPGA